MELNIFSSNVKYLREQAKLKQGEMLELIGVEPTTWSNYERGKSFPNLKLFQEIAKYFGVSETDLLNTDMSSASLIQKKEGKKSNKDASLNASPTAYPLPTESQNLMVSDHLGMHYEARENNVYDFTSPAAAGEAVVLLNKDKYRATPNLYLPGLGPGKHIRVPIAGDSMHSTVKDGDKAVATLVTDRVNIHEGFIFILLDREDGLTCKRVYFSGHNKVELVSDNQVYKPYKRDLKDILLWFKVREVHTSDLRPYWNDLRIEMRQLRDETKQLRDEMHDIRHVLKM